jgi:ribosomal protein S18 acetylase RimI-like enzyme
VRVSCRPLEREDRDWVVATLQEVWGSVLAARKGEVLDASEPPGFVALGDRGRMGLATCRVRGDEYEVFSLTALVEGEGVGRALMEQCFEDARTRGCRRVWLTTTNNNIRAIAFYQHVGMTMCAFYRDALEVARAFKPSIPLRDAAGIPIDHELEFELLVNRDDPLPGHH